MTTKGKKFSRKADWRTQVVNLQGFEVPVTQFDHCQEAMDPTHRSVLNSSLPQFFLLFKKKSFSFGFRGRNFFLQLPRVTPPVNTCSASLQLCFLHLFLCLPSFRAAMLARDLCLLESVGQELQPVCGADVACRKRLFSLSILWMESYCRTLFSSMT